MKKIKKKMKKREKLFCLLSFIFILGCCVFYGMRLMKYYKVFNPKKSDNAGLLSVEIPRNSVLVTEGDGLYRLNGSYIYRGNVDNNYIKYSGMLFRIIKINYGSNILLISDDSINSIYWGSGSDYKNSDINEYLNKYYVNLLDKSLLEKLTICNDINGEIGNASCKKDFKAYSSVLDSTNFLSTVTDNTFVSQENEMIWLSDTVNNDNPNIVTNGSSISYVNKEVPYQIKPVISLKYDTKLISGTGTKDDPYIVLDKDNYLGNIVSLGNYNWRVVNVKNDVATLALDGLLNGLKAYGNSFDPEDENSIAYYLNNEFYNSLDFKDKILKSEWFIGTYSSSYKEIEAKKINSFVGLPSIEDMKFTNGEQIPFYLLNTNNDEQVYLYDGDLLVSDKNIARGVKPVINVNVSLLKEVK